ncbi:hypothetical protein [Paraburkholderia sp. BL10I2N1]|uniref:hypothetical protein n=1 Tax=Paraburkholderia sp. BL10I2N1 TaxID=1938796 RepID=UPI001FB5BE12|nr:hypothetical protein [Paraburkholderia sp. BL10I2N1]
MPTLIDQDIAHIERVMRPSLYGDAAGPILSTAYWRRRLHQLLDEHHVTKAQLVAIDSLLLELDHFDRTTARPVTRQTQIYPAQTAAASRPGSAPVKRASDCRRSRVRKCRRVVAA